MAACDGCSMASMLCACLKAMSWLIVEACQIWQEVQNSGPCTGVERALKAFRPNLARLVMSCLSHAAAKSR